MAAWQANNGERQTLTGPTSVECPHATYPELVSRAGEQVATYSCGSRCKNSIQWVGKDDNEAYV